MDHPPTEVGPLSKAHNMDGSAQLASILESAIEDLRALLQCKICTRPMYEPYITSCGHSFCYSCLAQWFSNHRMNKTCPECRAKVSDQPAPAYVIRDMVQSFASRPELLEPGETTASQKATQEEEALVVERDKSDTDAMIGGLFRGCFRRTSSRSIIIDAEDGVVRCPDCAWELESGWCNHCERDYDVDADLNSVTNLSDSESYGSEEEYAMDMRPTGMELDRIWGGNIELDEEGLPRHIDHGEGINFGRATMHALNRHQSNVTRSIPHRRRQSSLSVVSVVSDDDSLESDEPDTDLDGFIQDDNTDINTEGQDDSTDHDSSSDNDSMRRHRAFITIDSGVDESDGNTTIRSGGTREESIYSNSDEGLINNEPESENDVSSDSSLASLPSESRPVRKRRRVLSEDSDEEEEETRGDMNFEGPRSHSRRRLSAQESFSTGRPPSMTDRRQIRI